MTNTEGFGISWASQGLRLAAILELVEVGQTQAIFVPLASDVVANRRSRAIPQGVVSSFLAVRQWLSRIGPAAIYVENRELAELPDTERRTNSARHNTEAS